MNPEEISHQLSLLAIYRTNLAHAWRQRDAYGGLEFAPNIVIWNINHAVDGIRRAKNALRARGYTPEDNPGEDENV